MERQIEVFFYGLFMDEDVLREQGFQPAGARQARLPERDIRSIG